MQRLIVAVLATVAVGAVAAPARAAVAVTAPPPGGATADTTPTIAGTATPGDVTIELSPAGAATPSFAFLATATEAGVFAADPVTPLGDGAWTVVARQATVSGVQSSAPVTVTVDTVAPVLSITAPAEGAALRTSQPQISGVAGADALDAQTVAVTLAGPVTTTLTATRGADGSFAMSPATALPDGQYVATATQTDAAGNSAAAAPRAFRIDTRAPTTTISSGPLPTGGGTRSITIEFGADEAASFRCTLDGAAPAACAPPRLVLRNLGRGRHRLTIAATDAAGNADATPATRIFSIDSPPDIPLGRTVGATKGGALRVTLRCPAAEATGPCAGTLSASRDGHSALAKAVAFEIAPGARAVVRAMLKPADRRVLRRNGRLGLRVTLVAADGRGNVGRASARRTLTLPGSKRT
jgi:hypothetical protein